MKAVVAVTLTDTPLPPPLPIKSRWLVFGRRSGSRKTRERNGA